MGNLLVTWFLTGPCVTWKASLCTTLGRGFSSGPVVVAPGPQGLLSHPHVLKCLPGMKLSTASLLKGWLQSPPLQQPRALIRLPPPPTLSPGVGLLPSQTLKRRKVLLHPCLRTVVYSRNTSLLRKVLFRDLYSDAAGKFC